MTFNLYDSAPGYPGALQARNARNTIGDLGERIAAQMLMRRGYTVWFARRGAGLGDLHVIDRRGLVQRIEVKTARRGADGRWSFLVWKAYKQDYRQAHWLLLLAVLRHGDVVPYVIPARAVGLRSKICLTSHPFTYTGRWAQYRQAPDTLNLQESHHVQTLVVPTATASRRQRSALVRPRSRYVDRDLVNGGGPAVAGPRHRTARALAGPG